MYYFSSLALSLNEPEEGVAPTDSRRRPDQRLMEDGHWDEANAEKQRLEEKQRTTRREREREAVKSPGSPEEGETRSACFVSDPSDCRVHVCASLSCPAAVAMQSIDDSPSKSKYTMPVPVGLGLHFKGVSSFHSPFTVIFVLANAGETASDESKYHILAL